jgi:hypothetical protein
MEDFKKVGEKTRLVRQNRVRSLFHVHWPASTDARKAHGFQFVYQ